MEPLISVIVPAFNVEQYLGNCLDSILAQTYKNIEIIIVDDGATDGSGKIADEYATKHVGKIISIHTENNGVTSARLTGVENAKGEWIGFVDGDDMIEPDMYQRLLGNALKYHADISHCGYRTVVNDGERIHYFYNTGRIVEQNSLSGLRDLLDGSFVEPGLCNKLFRKELFKGPLEGNTIDKTIRINEDLLMNYLLFEGANKSIYEDFCPYIYIARQSSVTRSGEKNYNKLFDPLKVKKYILDHVHPELNDLAWRKYLTTCYGTYSSIMNRRGYKTEAIRLKAIILGNRDKWKMLSNKERKRLYAIVFLPHMYCIVYNIYAKLFQKKVYE